MVKLFRPLLLTIGLFMSSMMIPNATDNGLMKAYTATTEESRHILNSFDLTILESNKIDKYPAICPLFRVSDATRVSSLYGPRMHPIYHAKSIHRGIDYAAPKGSKVITTGDGIVLGARRNRGYGFGEDLQRGYSGEDGEERAQEHPEETVGREVSMAPGFGAFLAVHPAGFAFFRPIYFKVVSSYSISFYLFLETL